jgi:hypothetical protein
MSCSKSAGFVNVPVVIRANPPRVCRQATVTMTKEDGAKLRQSLQYGTAKWTDIYRTGRSTNEGLNGLSKITSPIDIKDLNVRRVRDVAAQTVLIAIQLMAINFRRIESFLAQIEDDPGFVKKDARRDARKERSRPYQPRPSAKSKGPPVPV